MSPSECDKIIPISYSFKKVRTNDPEYYYETGSKTAMQYSPFMNVPLNIPKQNAINSVLVGTIDKTGIGEFKPKGSIRFSPDPKNPKIVQSIPIDLKQVKKGKGIIIGNPAIIQQRSASNPSDYQLFLVKSVDLEQKTVCLEQLPSKNIRLIK